MMRSAKHFPALTPLSVSFILALIVLSGPSTGTASVLYGVTDGDARLFQINPATAAVTFIGYLGITFPTRFIGMDYRDVDGIMYVGESRSGNLYSVDLTTGAATFVRSIPVTGGHILENMAFTPVPVPGPGGSTLPAGTLFASEAGMLHAIDVDNGTVQYIGETGIDDDAYAMSSSGTLYAYKRYSRFYSVNTRTGASTEISDVGTNGYSLAFGPDGFLYYTDLAWELPRLLLPV